MLNKLRQTTGYYALAITLVGILCSVVVYFGFGYVGARDVLKGVNVDALRLLTVAPIALSAFSVFIFNFLSKRVKRRVQWLMKKPAMNQFYALLVTELISVVVLGVLHANISHLFIAALDVSFNLIYTLFGFIILALAIRLFFNPKT